MKRLSLTILSVMAFFAIGFTVYFLVTSSHFNSINRVQAAQENHVQDNATVSFGAWVTSPATDRFPNLNPRFNNRHDLIPKTVTIRAGGTVNYIISGLHQVIVYDRSSTNGLYNIENPGPIDINTSLLVTSTAGGPPLINDPNGRVYRGPDPNLLPQDRVEVVHFEKPGLYLVICGVLPHFQEGMFGFVRVLPNNNNNNTGGHHMR